MSGYDESRWADSEFSAGYRMHADRIIQERRKLIGVLASFFGHFMGGSRNVDVLDLGCGDGAVTGVLMDAHPGIRATLLDGSPDMLNKASELLRGKGEAVFVRASFQELLEGAVGLPVFGFVFSSLAIHHLGSADKSALYSYAYEHLEPGGCFVNIDVVLPPSGPLDEWYLEIWRDWIEDAGGPVEEDVPARYKGNADNVPDTLGSQLDMLRSAGFRDVDCYYKHGIFAVFGGRR